MDNLTLEEAKQILAFYIKKASDLEISLLTGQININTLSAEVNSLKSQIASLNQQVENLKVQAEPAAKPKITKPKK
jgi:outer membrane murein-binding lipoprotein Lpp